MRREIIIRRATEADVEAMAGIVNLWIDSTPWKPRVHSRDTIQGFIHDALPDREIYVTGDPVEAYLSFDPVASKIGALFCGRTGKGVGKALLDHVRRGRDYVWLTSDEPNTRAHAFYRREGFTDAGYDTPKPPETLRELRMEWRA